MSREIGLTTTFEFEISNFVRILRPSISALALLELSIDNFFLLQIEENIFGSDSLRKRERDSEREMERM